MSNAVATTNDAAGALARLVLSGDMSKLTPEQKVEHYIRVCDSVGLNPATQPFEYLKLQGKEVLYAKRGAADQLRQIHGVSVSVVSKVIEDGLFIVEVMATDRNGRTDADIAAVPIAGLRGEAKANAIAKAITKAKRRVTLSICGLGFSDESEIEAIPGAQPVQSSGERLAALADAMRQKREETANAVEAVEVEVETVDAEPVEELSEPTAPGFTLTLPSGEVHDFATLAEFEKAYLGWLNKIAKAEKIPVRDRLSKMHALEEANDETLRLFEDQGETLHQKRLSINKRLAAQARDGGDNV